jgi:competence protein ComEC
MGVCMIMPRAAILTAWLRPGTGLAPGHDAIAPATAWLTSALTREAEQRTGFLWLVVAYGLGILTWFTATADPAWWWAPGLAVPVAILACRLEGWQRWLALAGLFFLLGIASAGWRLAVTGTPMLARPIHALVSGHVEAVDHTPSRSRLLIRVIGIEGLAPEVTPVRVKLGLAGHFALPAGTAIRLKASLAPPAGPALPGGFDFRRDAFFRQIGGIGYAVGVPQIWPDAPEAPLRLRLLAGLDDARNDLTRRIATTIGGPGGAVAAALVTGKRALIPEETNDALRLSGLYHIVSISGLHMVLAAGVLFWTLRAVLALSVTLALRWPIKKIAAGGAMLGAIAYCLFAGSEVATVRSLIMTLVMLGAILLDRPALAMRNLALSALIVLTWQPEALLGPSFQMSYAAVAALIASQRLWLPAARAVPEPASRPPLVWQGLRWFGIAFGGILATTIVASLATTPFAAYHFYRVNPFGLIGNAAGIPLVSLVVMPAAVAGSLLYPAGLDEPVWRLMGIGIDGVMRVAQWVAQFDKASLPAPALQHSAFLLFVLALLLLVLCVSALRWLAIVPLGLWLTSLAAPAVPDVIIHESGRLVLARAQGGTYRVLALGASPDFVLAQWLPALGDGRTVRDETLREGVRCDRQGCTLRLADGRWLALSLRPESLREDCRRADLVVTPLRRHGCPPDRVLADGSRLEALGTLQFWMRREGGWRQTGIRTAMAGRAWQQPRGAAAQPSTTTSDRRGPEARPKPRQEDPSPGRGDGALINTGEPD